jgi:hypothetical protein
MPSKKTVCLSETSDPQGLGGIGDVRDLIYLLSLQK